MYNSLFIFVIFGLLSLILFTLFKTVKKKNSHTINLTEAKLILNQSLICPKCQEKMSPGFVFAGKGIIWRSVNDQIISSWTTIYESLDNTLSFDLPPKLNLSWICHNCRCVLVDYSQMVNRKTIS